MALHSSSGPSHLGNVGSSGRRGAAAAAAAAATGATWPAASPPSSSALPHSSNGGRSRAEARISASGSSAGSSARRPIIGVLGGASPVSTVAFLEKLVRWSSEKRQGGEGEGEYLPFIVCSDPALSRKLSPREAKGSSPPRLLRSRKETRLDVDREGAVEGLRQQRLFLESSGARCIVMPCHVSHYWHREVSEGCSVPFLHMGDCVASELREAGLRPVEAGSNVRIGVLATGSALIAAVYQEKVQNLGYEAVLPDKATVEHTVIPAVEALSRRDMEGARTLLRITLHVLLVKAVNMIILASDDLRGLLPQDDPLLKRCVDPLEALARSTIEWAHSTRSL